MTLTCVAGDALCSRNPGMGWSGVLGSLALGPCQCHGGSSSTPCSLSRLLCREISGQSWQKPFRSGSRSRRYWGQEGRGLNMFVGEAPSE